MELDLDKEIILPQVGEDVEIIVPGFPHEIDSTMIAAYKSCPTYFFLAFVQKYKLIGESVHLHAGAAFATGVEMGRRAFYIDGKPMDEAQAIGLAALEEAYGDFVCPEGVAKTKERMLGALRFYFENYPFNRDRAQCAKLGDRFGVEFSYAIPLDFRHPTTGNPLLFAGRSDAVVDYAGGLYVMDEKTTSQLGASWSKQWDLRGQFSGYAWALQELGYDPAGCIIRGVSILKTKYETQQAIVPQPKWKRDRWHESAMSTIADMLHDYGTGKWDYDLGEACNFYGGCSFKMCCNSADPQPWLDSHYERSDWSPLKWMKKK